MRQTGALALAALVATAAVAAAQECVECPSHESCAGTLGDLAAELGLTAVPGSETCLGPRGCALAVPVACEDVPQSQTLVVAGDSDSEIASWSEYDQSRHAFYCHACFGGDACPLTACSQWRAVPGTTVLHQAHGNGTALLKGEVVSACDENHRLMLHAELSGRTTTPPQGSPKHPKGTQADTDAFVYYTETDMLATGLGELAGLAVRFSRKGPAFQVGVGANDKDASYGASGWVMVASVDSQANFGECIFSPGSVMDLNLDLDRGGCLVAPPCGEPPVIGTCSCHDYEVDCGCSGVSLPREGQGCASLAFVPPADADNLDCTPREMPCRDGP